MTQRNNVSSEFKIILAKTTVFFAVFCLGFIANAQAQSLYISPEAGQYSVSSAFSVKIYLESGGIPVNAVQATINFPADLLEVKNVSKEGSAFTLWPQEPEFSNTNGKISFSGGVPAPGINGTGKILTVNFKIKKEGDAALSITDGVLLKADGNGTNILSNNAGSVYKANYELIVKNTNTPEGNGAPPENNGSNGEFLGFSFSPSIFSLSHPDQSQWYKERNIKIGWKISKEVVGVSAKLDKNSFSAIALISQGVFDEKSYDNTEDGVWYFHLKAKNQSSWSKTFNFKVQIDTVSPKPFNIKIDNYGDLTAPQPSLYFEAIDDLSGVAGYEVKIDDGNILSVDLGKTNPFVLPLQAPGTHSVSIWASDRAGNKTESHAEFEIKSIEVPDILIYTKAYNAGEEIFYLEGTSAPNSKITIFFEKSGRIKTWQTLSDSEGNWSFLTDELFKSGTYKLYAMSEDRRGAISSPSSEHEVEVVLNGIAIGSFLVSYYNLLFVIVAFIFLITILTAYIYKKSVEEKIKIKKEVSEAQFSLEDAFKNLRKKITKKIEYFDGKPGLNPEEKKTRNEIVAILNNSEKIVGKEIKDIENEIK